jgi:hypothetical protein
VLTSAKFCGGKSLLSALVRMIEDTVPLSTPSKSKNGTENRKPMRSASRPVSEYSVLSQVITSGPPIIGTWRPSIDALSG